MSRTMKTRKLKLFYFQKEVRHRAKKLWKGTFLGALFLNEDKNFVGLPVLNSRIWWRHVKTKNKDMLRLLQLVFLRLPSLLFIQEYRKASAAAYKPAGARLESPGNLPGPISVFVDKCFPTAKPKSSLSWCFLALKTWPSFPTSWKPKHDLCWSIFFVQDTLKARLHVKREGTARFEASTGSRRNLPFTT